MKLIAAALVFSQLFTSHTAVTEKWIIEKNSKLNISGKSNVSNYQCDITEYLHADTILFYKEQENQSEFVINGGLVIDVNNFDCHQRNMTHDLRRTLKADKNPALKIELLSIGNFSGDNNCKGFVAITLGGIRQVMHVNYTVQSIDNINLHVYGSCNVLFSDFALIPPRKMAGLIKVEQEIKVAFQLNLRPFQNDMNNRRFLINSQ